jgi:3-oxoadipate enol-lactonase
VTDVLQAFGTRGRPVLVVAGSLASDASVWQAQFAQWAGTHDIRFYAYPGHGGRGMVDSALQSLQSLEALGDELLAALDAQGLQRFDFIGLSLGAMLGLHLAGRAPRRLQRLVACCCRFHQTPELVAQWDARIAAVLRTGMSAVAQPTLERWLTAAFRDREPASAAAVLSMLQSTHPQGYAAAAAAVRDGGLRGRLPVLGERALVLSGALDLAAPTAHMAELAAALGSAHVQLPACAHLPNLEQPAMFNAAVAGWLH